MSILDSIMGSLGGGGGITQMVEGQVASAIAAKMGIDPSMAQTAIAALTQAHPQPGDTVQAAADQSGIPSDTLSQIMGHLGGEGGLGSLVGAMSGQAAPAAEGAATGAGGVGGMLSGVLGGLMGGNKS